MKNEELQTKVIIVDSNAWNFLFESNIDLFSSTFEKFRFAITWMIEKEMECMSNREDKKDLIAYYNQYKPCVDRLKKPFGFYASNVPDDMQRCVGFGQGPFIALKESEQLVAKSKFIGKQRKTLLFKNETDLNMACKAYGNVFILTRDFKKPGPLKDIENLVGIPDTPLSELDFKELLCKSTTR